MSYSVMTSSEHWVTRCYVQSLRRARLCDPVDCSMPGLPVHHQLQELELVIDSVMPSSHLILCQPLLLLEPHGAPPLHSSLFSNTLSCKPKSLCIEENNRIRKTRDGMLEGNKCYERNNRSTPGGPVKIPCFQYRGSGFNPQSGNWDHTCLLVWSKEGKNRIKWALSK